MMALCFLLLFAADHCWLAGLRPLCPNWLFLFPLALLFLPPPVPLPRAPRPRRRALWPLLLASVVILVPIMDLCIPWRKLTASTGDRPKLRVLTCNIHHSSLDTQAMANLLADVKPDIIAFQEYTSSHHSLLF